MKPFYVTIILLLLGLSPGQARAQEYGPEVPYQEAVPNFWNAVGEAVYDFSGREEIAGWADRVSNRVEEFFDDMTASMAAQESKPLGSADISEIEAFNEKWSAVLDTCPDCDQAVPLVQPVVDELLAGLTALRPTQSQDNPFQNFLELFRELEALNPWGTAALFQLEPLDDSREQVSVNEQARTTRVSGVEETFVQDRRTEERENGRQVFYERISGDEVQQVGFASDSVTMIHDVLDDLIRDGGDPQLIAALADLAALVDDELKKAWQSGLLDDFTYFFLFDQAPIQNELVHVKHPLLKVPYDKEYKTAEYYPRTFEDSRALRLNAVARAERIQQALDSYSLLAENASALWLLGVLAPLSAFSLMGIGKSVFFSAHI